MPPASPPHPPIPPPPHSSFHEQPHGAMGGEVHGRHRIRGPRGENPSVVVQATSPRGDSAQVSQVSDPRLAFDGPLHLALVLAALLLLALAVRSWCGGGGRGVSNLWPPRQLITKNHHGGRWKSRWGRSQHEERAGSASDDEERPLSEAGRETADERR